jgi:hypothetical protein
VVVTYYVSGSLIASGQAYNSGGYTTAHRTLPFGSQVTATNPENGKSIAVMIAAQIQSLQDRSAALPALRAQIKLTHRA